MDRSLFSSLLVIAFCGIFLTACAHETPILDDTSTAKINVKTLSAAQTLQAQDLLAIKDLNTGDITQNINGASYQVMNSYHAASGAFCKNAIIRRSASSMTGFDTTANTEKLHACYKGDLAFLPSPKLR